MLHVNDVKHLVSTSQTARVKMTTRFLVQVPRNDTT
jgi:hypothetical protein